MLSSKLVCVCVYMTHMFQLPHRFSLEQMAKLPNAAAYERFAYHIALLQQFAFEPERAAHVASNSKKLRGNSATPSSVHGSSVFASFRKKRSAVALRRANSSENVGMTSSY